MKFTLLLVILLLAPAPLFAQGAAKFLRDVQIQKELAGLQKKRTELVAETKEARKAGDQKLIDGCKKAELALEESERDLRAKLKVVIPPKDLRTSVRNFCPVHRIAMPTRRIPIVYGSLMPIAISPPPELRAREFPYAKEWWWAGCVVRKYSPDDALAFVCPECVRREKTWSDAEKSKTSSAPRWEMIR